MARNYSRKENPTGSDLALIWDAANSDWRLATLTDIRELFEANADVVHLIEKVSQYSVPLTGGTVVVTDGDDDDADVHLFLTPAGTLSTLTITLPAVAGLRDKQEVLVSSSQIVTTLTVGANGASSIVGGPTAFTAGGFFTLKYDLITTTWNRIG